MGHDAPQLDYAAARPAKRRWRRWVAGVLLVALVGAGVAYRGPIVRRGRVLYWQRLCLTYSRSAGTPLATTRPSAAADPDYVAYPMPDGSTAYALSPACWRKLEAERWPRQIMQMLKVSGIGPAVVFLHERVSPAGHRRVPRHARGARVGLARTTHGWRATGFRVQRPDRAGGVVLRAGGSR